eukprot:1161220-Ditylum_brightwellii.AAC.1
MRNIRMAEIHSRIRRKPKHRAPLKRRPWTADLDSDEEYLNNGELEIEKGEEYLPSNTINPLNTEAEKRVYNLCTRTHCTKYGQMESD